MQRKPLFSLLIGALVIMLFSCRGKADKSAITVPNDAAMVFHINAPSLSKKLPWEEIKKTSWFQELYSEADDSLAKKMLDNPENSGINTEADLVFFMKKIGRGGYMVFEGLLKDAAAFESFNKQVNKNVSVTKDGDYSVIRLDDKKTVLAWTPTKFVYVINTPFLGAGNNMNFGSGDNSFSQPSDISSDSLLILGKELFDLPAEKSLYKDDRFASIMKENGDIHVWINNQQTYSNMVGGMLDMLKLNILFDKNATGMTISFDDGKISLKSRQFFNEEMMKLFKKYPGKAVSADVVNRIPSQNVMAAFVMNYPPEGMKEFMKLVGVDGMANGYLEKMGYSVDEFIRANKGDLVLSVSDFTMQGPPVAEPGEEPVPGITRPDVKVLFATSINDKAAFDKLVGVVKAQIGDIPEGNGIPKITYNLNKDWFAISNDQAQVDKFLAGGNNNNPFASRISGHAYGGFMDLQKIMTAFGSSEIDSTGKAALDASLKMWQDVIMTGDALKGESLDYDINVNLVDKSTNSLKQLNAYFDKLAALKNKNSDVTVSEQ
jgi:hypothetical protein